MEDRLLGHLAAGEQVLYRAPRGTGRLNRRVLTLQALAGLMVFMTVSGIEGHWSVETSSAASSACRSFNTWPMISRSPRTE